MMLKLLLCGVLNTVSMFNMKVRKVFSHWASIRLYNVARTQSQALIVCQADLRLPQMVWKYNCCIFYFLNNIGINSFEISDQKDGNGVYLEHLISFVPGVEIVTSHHGIKVN